MNHDYINEINLIDQYVMGKLAADEVEEFENHFADCPECVEQLNHTRSFIHDLKGLAVQETLESGQKLTPAAQRWNLQQLIPFRYWPAIACGLIVIAGLFLFFGVRRMTRLEAQLNQADEAASATRQEYQRGLETAAESEKRHEEDKQRLTQRLDELEKKLRTETGVDQRLVRGSEAPEVNFPIYALVATARTQGTASVEIAPGYSSRFALSIPVEDRRLFSSYRVTIVDHKGTTVWKRDGFRADAYHTLSLSLKSTFLAPGTYDLRVEGFTPPDRWDTVGSFPFRMARR